MSGLWGPSENSHLFWYTDLVGKGLLIYNSLLGILSFHMLKGTKLINYKFDTQ